MTCRPRNIIKSSQLKEAVRYKDGDTPDIITAILEMDRISDRWVNKDEVECLRGNSDEETLYNVWALVKKNVRYRPDRPGREVVKSPGALFKIKSGDCKSFSIAEAAMLRQLGFKNIKFRFVSYSPDAIVTHVYIVVRHKGQEYILDAVHDRFDQEVPYTFKQDIKAYSSGISGIPAQKPAAANNNQKFVGLALIAWALIA